MKRVISPSAINALKEALTNIYWYKRDLKSFILNSISTPQILSRLDWDDYKRNIVGSLIDFMASRQDEYKDDLLKLMYEVMQITDFTHLKLLDDGIEKAKKAEDSVKALRKLTKGFFDYLEEESAKAAKRKETSEKMMKNVSVLETLDDIKKEYSSLVITGDPQSRGYKLEKILKDLFLLYDLDPKASFKIIGEQIDGAFNFKNIDFLLEAKWHQDPVSLSDLDSFSKKVSRKLDNTLGLFISINGFTEESIRAHSTSGRSLIILMDGRDLMAAIENRISFPDLLLRKKTHAAQTGNVYLRVDDILLNYQGNGA